MRWILNYLQIEETLEEQDEKKDAEKDDEAPKMFSIGQAETTDDEAPRQRVRIKQEGDDPIDLQRHGL